jgi:hypothetical protein
VFSILGVPRQIFQMSVSRSRTNNLYGILLPKCLSNIYMNKHKPNLYWTDINDIYDDDIFLYTKLNLNLKLGDGYLHGDATTTTGSVSSYKINIQQSLVIAFNPTRHFSYSSGSRSSMYLLILCLGSFLKYDTSLFTVASPTCSVCDISLCLYPLLQSSCSRDV